MTLDLAEEAFINAVVASMKTQAELIPLTRRLQKEMQSVAMSNERVLRSQGITETSPLEDVLEQQRKYLDEAVKRSELGEDHPVVQGLRSQADEMEESYRALAAAELGKIDGPAL